MMVRAVMKACVAVEVLEAERDAMAVDLAAVRNSNSSSATSAAAQQSAQARAVLKAERDAMATELVVAHSSSATADAHSTQVLAPGGG